MAIDQVLKRHFWSVNAALTAVAAFLNAQAITQLVGANLGVDEKQLAAPPAMAKVSGSATKATVRTLNADGILSRNPFDSVTGPLDHDEKSVSDSSAETSAPDYMDRPFEAPACDGVKVLVITSSSDPDWSFAAMMAPGETKSVLRRRGGELGGKTVIYVGWDRVWLMSGNQLCQAQMYKSANEGQRSASTPPPPPPPASSPPPSSGGAHSVPPDIMKGISRVSANEFNVDRGVVDKILENQADLMRQARIVPEQENGKLVGIRLFGVRPDTLLGVLGLENGDRLQTINGFDMTSPEKALEAYARLRTADNLTVQVNRRGSNQNIDFHIK